MSENKTENSEHQQIAQVTPKKMETTASGGKIFPTSFLPEKSHMEPSRIPTAKMTGFQIEVIHVILFFLLTFALFYGMWKRAGSR